MNTENKEITLKDFKVRKLPDSQGKKLLSIWLDCTNHY